MAGFESEIPGSDRRHTDASDRAAIGASCSHIMQGITSKIQGKLMVKGKALPLQAWTDPESSRNLRLPDLKKKSAHEVGKVVSPTHRLPLPLSKYSSYSFLLEAESTPVP